MSILAQQTTAEAAIYPDGEILAYANDTEQEVVILCEVELGNLANPIVGGGPYSIRASIDDVEIVPDSQVVARLAQTKVVIQSRHLVLPAGANLKLTVLGRDGDSAVYARVTVYDVTPMRSEDLLGGGDVIVDHDYGDTDSLRVTTAEGVGVSDVEIRAYLTVDYAANRRDQSAVRGRTTTDADGRWQAALMLGAGDYTLVIAKPSQIQTKIVDLEVT